MADAEKLKENLRHLADWIGTSYFQERNMECMNEIPAVDLPSLRISIKADTSQFTEALALLAEIAQSSHEVVDGFLRSLDSLSQLVRLDGDFPVASGTGDYRIAFKPSDLLVEFMTATRASQRE